MTDDTVLMVGSAPSYAHGVVDPISELAAIAAEHDLAMHVDACVGGFFLPFVEQLGRDVPPWDFRVPGVTSISADLHKHGYTAKGASTLLHREPGRARVAHLRLRRLAQRPLPDRHHRRHARRRGHRGRLGGAHYLGEAGYRRIVGETMRVTDQLIEGINETPGLEVWGAPVMNKFGYGSRDFDIGAVADGLEARGWMVGRQKEPPGINMHVFPVHGPIADAYLRDLADVARLVARGELEGSAASRRRITEARWGAARAMLRGS